MAEKAAPLLPLKPPWLFAVIGMALIPGAGAVIEMLAVMFVNAKLPIAMAAGYGASLLALLAAIVTPFLPAKWFYAVQGAKGRTVVCLLVMSLLLAIITSGYHVMS